MKKTTIFLLLEIVLLSLFIQSCSKEENSPKAAYKFEILEELTHDSNLRTANYDSESRTFLLAYSLDYGHIRFEIRDDNFNIIRSGVEEGNYFASPHTLEIINDSLKIGNDTWDYYKLNESLLISNLNSKISFYNSENTYPIFSYQFKDSFRGFIETDEHVILSAARETCYFINKFTYEITSYKNYFIEAFNSYNYGNGYALGKDEQNRIILSTKSDGVLVYSNNDWISFWEGKLDTYSRFYNQFFLDSNGLFYARTAREIFVFDSNTKERLLTITGTANVDFSFSRILGEHTDGSIIILTGLNRSPETNRIHKIKVLKNI